MKWSIYSICILCILALAGITLGADKTANDIFLQQGSNGSFVNDSSGNYTLTMTDVVPYTVYFADRPARDTGFVPMDKFLKGFDFGVNNPPNAAIILPEENETSDMVVVKLTNPQYNNTTQTVTYNAKLLKDYSFKSGWLQDHMSEVDPAIPERFGSVDLVIDGCPCMGVGPGAGCDATWWRNSCFRFKSPGKSRNGGDIFCVPCGGCCPCEGSCCPGQNCDKSKNPTNTKPPLKEEKQPVEPVKEKTNEVKYPYTTS